MANTRTLTTLPLLFTDIETIPSQDPAIIAEIEAKFPLPILDLDGIKADGRLKDAEKIEADLTAKREKATADHAGAIEKRLAAIDEAYRKTALDGGKGHIASVAWSFDEDVVVAVDNHVLKNFGPTMPVAEIQHGERTMLTCFFGELEETLDVWSETEAGEEIAPLPKEMNFKPFQPIGAHLAYSDPEEWVKRRAAQLRLNPVVVAHYADFDIRFIWQRAIALGVPVPAWWPINASKYANDKIQDTMVQWAGHGNRISLDALCRILGVPGKGNLDGSGVWDAIKAGRLEDVVEYNRCDVRSLRSVHRRMRGLEVLPQDTSAEAEEEFMYRRECDRRPGPVTDSDDTPGWLLSKDGYPFEWTETKPLEIDENVVIQACTYGQWKVAEQKAWDAAKDAAAVLSVAAITANATDYGRLLAQDFDGSEAEQAAWDDHDDRASNEEVE